MQRSLPARRSRLGRAAHLRRPRHIIGTQVCGQLLHLPKRHLGTFTAETTPPLAQDKIASLSCLFLAKISGARRATRCCTGMGRPCGGEITGDGRHPIGRSYSFDDRKCLVHRHRSEIPSMPTVTQRRVSAAELDPSSFNAWMSLDPRRPGDRIQVICSPPPPSLCTLLSLLRP